MPIFIINIQALHGLRIHIPRPTWKSASGNEARRLVGMASFGEQGGTANDLKGAQAPSDLIEWFNSTIQRYDATFVVYYRGLR